MDCSFVLAAVLLTTAPAAPVGKVLPAPVPDALVQALRPSLIALAIDAEILDGREIRSNDVGAVQDAQGVWRVASVTDLQFLQGRWHTLRDAPQLGELARWPDVGTLGDMLALNRSVRTYLDARRGIDLVNADALRADVENLDCLHGALDSLRDAASPGWYVHVRRAAFASFRDRIGPTAWAAGVLPDAVPCVPREPAPQPDRRIRRMPEK